MKSISIYIFLMLLTYCSGISAQDKELDKIPFPVGGIEQIAKNINYPPNAKENKLEGDVFIKAVISEERNVLSTEIIKSLGTECDNAAADAVKKTKFTPGIKDGKAVECKITIPVRFKLG
ncbi:MAG TPA: energy transducer TonB [Ignavibacteriaceae bacterium]|nr:energy transducer TonB [Ignavibacteriaceae bacterium]